MSTAFLPIQAVARKLEIPDKYLEKIGPNNAKVRLEILADPTCHLFRAHSACGAH